MAQSKKSKIFALVIVVLAIGAFLTAWGRLAWMGAVNMSAARFLENKNAGADQRQVVSCQGNAVYYNQAIWQFPCEYKKYFKPDSNEEFEIASGFNRWDIEAKTNELSWQMPELEGKDGEIYPRVKDYTLFAFAPRPERPEQILVGLRGQDRNYLKTFEKNEGRETLYFYILDAGENRNAKKFGAELTVQRSEVSGVDWNGDELEVVVRAENGAARIFGSSGEGDWKTRDVEEGGCGKNQKCQLEVAFREQNVWQFVYSRLSLDALGSISEARVEFWQGAENGSLSKFNELSVEQSGNNVFTSNPKNVWFDESFDASSGNVLARNLSRRPFRRVNNEWKQLELPLENNGSAADLRFDAYQGASYFHDGVNLTWFPVGNYMGKDEIVYDKEWLNYQNRWLTGIDADRSRSDLSEQAIKIRDVRTNEEKYIVGANRGWWFHEYDADAMPLPNGDLLIFNWYNDYVRLNSNLERVDKMSLTERFDRMIIENFRLYGKGSYDGYIYNRNFAFGKQASIPLILLAFPLFLLIGEAYRRTRNQKSGSSFRRREAMRGAAIGYLAICLVFGYYFWILTGFF